MVEDTLSSAVVNDEGETTPFESVEKEKHTTANVMNDGNDSVVEMYEERVTILLLDGKKEIQSSKNHDKNVDDTKSMVKDDEKENHEGIQTSARDSDEEKDKSPQEKHSQNETENEGEEEEDDDEKTDEDDHENND
jgi:hypothetical protein